MTALDMMTAARGQSHIGKWGIETVHYYSERRVAHPVTGPVNIMFTENKVRLYKVLIIISPLKRGPCTTYSGKRKYYHSAIAPPVIYMKACSYTKKT